MCLKSQHGSLAQARNTGCAAVLLVLLQDKRKEVWDTESWPELWPEDIPRQCNGCDCGVFALLFCSRLGLGAPFDFHQDDLLLNARVKVCCELLDGRLPLPAKPH